MKLLCYGENWMRVAEAGTFHHIIRARTCLNLLHHLQSGLAPVTSSGRLCPKEAVREVLTSLLLPLTPNNNNPNNTKFLFHRFLHSNNLPKAHPNSKGLSIILSKADLDLSMVIKDPINRVTHSLLPHRHLQGQTSNQGANLSQAELPCITHINHIRSLPAAPRMLLALVLPQLEMI